MAPYGIPTGQLADFRQSAHGIALLEHENFTAPSCVGCHGSHSALPPRVLQIANVCGRCHVLVRQEFEAGPHDAAAREGRSRVARRATPTGRRRYRRSRSAPRALVVTKAKAPPP
jgi:predicted CXXCH cytochrome family protein